MRYIGYFIIVNGHNIKKNENFPFFTSGGWKTAQQFVRTPNAIEFVRTPNAIEPPTNSNLEGPMARARWGRRPL